MGLGDAGARAQLLDAVAAATDQLGQALAALGAAYEHLDDPTADRLEEELFRPLQTAYGRAQRTYAAFAQRAGLPARAFAVADTPAGARGVTELLTRALDAVHGANDALIGLQDSMMPVEFGDAELRHGLGEVRSLISVLPARARGFTRTRGR